MLLSRDYAAVAALPAPFWQGVEQSARWRYLVFPGDSLPIEEVLQALAIIALLCTLLGLYARPASLVAGALLYHLAPLESLFWLPAPYVRGQTLAVLGLVILGASPCDHALSLRRPRHVPVESYGWPVRLMQVLVCQVYLYSGLAKIRYAGWNWASPESLRHWLLRATNDPDWTVYTRLGRWLADRPLMCAGVGVGTLLLEMGFSVALFWRGGRAWIVSAALLFHLGILFSMNLTFLAAPILLVFIEWDRWAVRLAGVRLRPAESPG